LSQLYFTSLAREALPIAVTGGVCYCCKTAVAVDRRGTLFVAWRHVYPGNLRDIAFSMSRDGGRTFLPPVRVSEDRWRLDGCPDDGPSMAVDQSGRVHLVWPTVVDEHGAPVKVLFYSTTNDGRQFTPRVRVPTEGQANHPQLALSSDGAPLVVWDELRRGGRFLASARVVVDRQGARAITKSSFLQDERGAYPAVASTREGWLVAWTSGDPTHSVIRVQWMPE
jgi:hypothetical protein